jgi:magnesium transporter
MPEIINCAAYSDGCSTGSIELKDINNVLQEANQFVWIGLYEPSEEVLNRVQQEFGLHDLAIEDANTAHQRPKIELYGDSLFVVLRTAQMNEQHHAEFGETHLFVGANYIVAIRHGSSVSYVDVRAQCEQNPQLLKKGPGFVLYAIMDFILDKYYPVVQDMEAELENIEDKIFNDKPSRATTEQIYLLKRELLEVKRAVSPLIDICNRLMRFDLKVIAEDTRPYFRDVYDNVIRVNEIVDNTRELLNTALEANFSLISISQSEVSKKFAGWAAIFAVPTMVAGFYGMNFRSIPQMDQPLGFYEVLLATLASCFLLYAIFKRTGWL